MTTKSSQPEVLSDEMARGIDLLERVFAAGYGIAADREVGIELDDTPYAREFMRGNVLPPAARPKAEELTPDERARRERIIEKLLS